MRACVRVLVCLSVPGVRRSGDVTAAAAGLNDSDADVSATHTAYAFPDYAATRQPAHVFHRPDLSLLPVQPCILSNHCCRRRSFRVSRLLAAFFAASGCADDRYFDPPCIFRSLFHVAAATTVITITFY